MSYDARILNITTWGKLARYFIFILWNLGDTRPNMITKHDFTKGSSIPAKSLCILSQSWAKTNIKFHSDSALHAYTSLLPCWLTSQCFLLHGSLFHQLMKSDHALLDKFLHLLSGQACEVGSVLPSLSRDRDRSRYLGKWSNFMKIR